MPDIVGIRFKRAGKVYYFDPIGAALNVCDYVVVQTARGVELGQVIIAPKQVLASEVTTELKPIVRKATDEDTKHAQDFASKEDNALTECAKMITKLNLPMKLVSAEYNLDGSRLTFYFTADERVDFRELVRELTAFFRTRIELRQIGPRDQAKLVGGLGRCGRPLCCGAFLTEFSPVSIKMAKEQDLPLDPMKISGVCGRLQCCLAYESDQYREAKAAMPRKGQRVETPAGLGIVSGVFPLKESVLVVMESAAEAEFPLTQIKIIIGVLPAPEPGEPEATENETPVNKTAPASQPEPTPVSQPEPASAVQTEPARAIQPEVPPASQSDTTLPSVKVENNYPAPATQNEEKGPENPS